MARSPQQRTLDAEVRAVTEGHRARLAPDNGRRMLVLSDTLQSVNYRVGISMVGETVVFTCDHGRYDRETRKYHADRPEARTFVPCKHGAVAARRLEREGLLRWDGGQWVPTEKAYRLGAAERPVADPFDGLPQ